MKLTDLINKHKGEDVWVIGTGPSLNTLEDNELVGPRILINRAMFSIPVLPDATYWMVYDDAWANGVPGPWASTLAAIQSGSLPAYGVFRNPLVTPKGGNAAPTGDRIIHWSNGPKPRVPLLRRSREDLAEHGLLYQYAGTASPAIHLAWLMGAARVRLVGVDGTDGYAARLRQFYDRPARGGLGYQMARHDAIKCAALLDIHVDDFSKRLKKETAHENV